MIDVPHKEPHSLCATHTGSHLNDETPNDFNQYGFGISLYFQYLVFLQIISKTKKHLEEKLVYSFFYHKHFVFANDFHLSIRFFLNFGQKNVKVWLGSQFDGALLSQKYSLGNLSESFYI